MQFHVLVTEFVTPEHAWRVVDEAPTGAAAQDHAWQLNRANCTEYGFAPRYFVHLIDLDVRSWAFRLDEVNGFGESGLVADELLEAYAEYLAAGLPSPSEPLDVWLRIPKGEEESEAEANTFRDGDRFRVDWYLTSVGLIKSRMFDSYADAETWLTAEGFADFTS